MESDPHPDLRLAQQAQTGDTNARRQVNRIAEPIIRYQNGKFCKRFCREHQYQYRCTLSDPIGNPPADAAMCEWGNAGYAWMLDELTRPERLQKYAAKNAAGLQSYFFHIANSLAFYERWKDWRFGRRVYVPEYIRELAPDAAKVFYLLRSNSNLDMIAQDTGLDHEVAEGLVKRITMELVKRKRLYLLDAPEQVSLTRADEAGDMDIPVTGFDPEADEQRRLFLQAWEQLDEVEQFVLEAMLIENKTAETVLYALGKMNVRLGKGDKENNTQQLYYFRRKALDRLTGLINSNHGSHRVSSVTDHEDKA